MERFRYHFFRLQKSVMRRLNRYYSHFAGDDQRPVFFSISKTCPELQEFDRNFLAIRNEMLALLPNVQNIPLYLDVDNLQAYRSRGYDRSVIPGWRVFMLYLTGIDVKANQQRCPTTTRLLKNVPNLFQAFFSILEPGKPILEHCGPYLGYIRYHLALLVPADRPPELIVNNQRYRWEEGKSVLFDDSWPHRVENESPQIRVVLIVDILRPLPLIPHFVNKLVSRVLIKHFYANRVYANLKAWVGTDR